MEDAEFVRGVFLASSGIPFDTQERMTEAALGAAFNLNLIWKNPEGVRWDSATRSLMFRRTPNG